MAESERYIYHCVGCGFFWTYDRDELDDDGLCVDCSSLKEWEQEQDAELER